MRRKKTYQWPKGRRTTSLGPSFVASPSSAVLPFSRFVAAPVPTPRAVARGRGWGPLCRWWWWWWWWWWCPSRRRPVMVVLPCVVVLGSWYRRHGHWPPLFVLEHPRSTLLAAACSSGSGCWVAFVVLWSSSSSVVLTIV